MGPKVFISSTYYDLKYIREDLEQFVKRYRFETIMFENGDIGYAPGRPLDESCYHYISKADMVVLVVGGLYGSPATGEEPDEFNEYMSITRKEFQAAKDSEIPIYVFIEADVDAEFEVYLKNYDAIENKKSKIVFNATKNINVFRFIRTIRRYNNVVINKFKRTSEIKEYLANLWAGYFLNYLELMRENRKNREIEDRLELLKRNIDQINLMVDEVGKKLLTEKEEGSYENIKERQIISDIKNIIVNSITITPVSKVIEERKIFAKALVDKIASMMKDNTFPLYASNDLEDQEKFYSLFNFDMVMIEHIKPGVELELKDYVEYLQEDYIKNEVAKEIVKDEKFWIFQVND
jgi:hypothetical protein